MRKLYGPIMGREMVCISQRNHSRYASDSQLLILCPYKFMKERRPGPLVRPAIGVYNDIQFQKGLFRCYARIAISGIWDGSADIHSSLSGNPNKSPPNTSAIYCPRSTVRLLQINKTFFVLPLNQCREPSASSLRWRPLSD